jgi:hypothetical protein
MPLSKPNQAQVVRSRHPFGTPSARLNPCVQAKSAGVRSISRWVRSTHALPFGTRHAREGGYVCAMGRMTPKNSESDRPDNLRGARVSAPILCELEGRVGRG